MRLRGELVGASEGGREGAAGIHASPHSPGTRRRGRRAEHGGGSKEDAAESDVARTGRGARRGDAWVSGLRGESSWRGGRSVQGTARHQGRRLRGLRGLRGPRAECQMRGSQGEQGQNTGAGTGPREPAFRGGDEGAGVEETARQWTRATTWRGGRPFPQEEGAAEPAPAGPDARPRSFGKHSGFRFF